MRKLHYVSLLSLLIIFASCLTYSTVRYDIEFDDNFESGKIFVTYTDLRSSEESVEKQKSDFAELIKMLEEDKFLLDSMEDGIYIKERDLSENNGKITGSYSGIFKKLRFDSQELKQTKNERTLTIDKDDGDVVKTNGKILESADTFIIAWPVDEHKLYFSINKNYDDKTYSLLDYLKEYRNK